MDQPVEPSSERTPGERGPVDRDLGEQPLEAILTSRELSAHDLVAASTEQITHKMVTRARKGRRLTPNVQRKIRNALVAAAGQPFELSELFNYS